MGKVLMPTQAELLELLCYDPETGNLTWRERSRNLFANDNVFGTWNTRYAGKPALNALSPKGYRHGAVNKKIYFAHRVIWVMVHGYAPRVIDHINGMKSDNRICNLREVSSRENQMNMRRRVDNTSGVTGVYRNRSHGWRSQININGRHLHLGVFDDLDAAIAARKDAELRFGFHENHGRIA